MIARFIKADIGKYISLILFKNKWRKNNKHNSTLPSVVFNMDTVIVGKYTYGGLRVKNYGDTKTKLIIGNYCSIAENSEFYIAGEHAYSSITTFPLKKYGFNSTEVDTMSKGDIVIEDDVWIGDHSIILSGVRIGQGAIVGAGSIVSKNIPPYAIFIGNNVKKYRFSENVINKLCCLNFDKITPEELRLAEEFDSIELFINSELYKRLCRS